MRYCRRINRSRPLVAPRFRIDSGTQAGACRKLCKSSRVAGHFGSFRRVGRSVSVEYGPGRFGWTAYCRTGNSKQVSGSVEMRAIWLAMLIGLITVPAYAQGMMPGFRLNEEKTLTEDEIARNKANEDAAKAARAKIPDGKASSDPWATVRTAEPAKAPKSKTR